MQRMVQPGGIGHASTSDTIKSKSKRPCLVVRPAVSLPEVASQFSDKCDVPLKQTMPTCGCNISRGRADQQHRRDCCTVSLWQSLLHPECKRQSGLRLPWSRTLTEVSALQSARNEKMRIKSNINLGSLLGGAEVNYSQQPA